MIYGKVHRFMLRSVASRGVVTVEEATNLLRTLTDDEEVSVKSIVKDINNELRDFKQMIKITNDEMTDENLLIFLSLGFDDATKAQNIFSANELEFFRLLIEEIMVTEVRQISEIHAINLVNKMKGTFTKLDGEKRLKLWCNMRYLDKANGNFVLGVRAIHEFETYLRQNMPDAIEECCLCKNIVFRGCNCPSCAAAVHSRCLLRYREQVDRWPCCQAEYDARQLEGTQRESSRFSSQRGGESVAYDTTADPVLESTQETSIEDEDMTQSTMAVSQSATRKRKRNNEKQS